MRFVVLQAYIGDLSLRHYWSLADLELTVSITQRN